MQVLRFLHGQDYEVVIRRIDHLRCFGIKPSGQFARADATGGSFVLKRETNFCTVHIDEVGRAAAADKGYVVNRHQKFGAKERSIGRAKDQNSANHRKSLLLWVVSRP